MPGYGIVDSQSGIGLLPWRWATERLKKARTYWISTTRPDGSPHAMPIWGVWMTDAFYFSTGHESRKAKNLGYNPKCVISAEIITDSPINDAVILEGTARQITDRAKRKKFAEAYGPKYDYDMEGFDEPVYSVKPKVVFAFTAQFIDSATRWTF
jgi:nitroimidazol reductase NimA-like FMN-containing flavoprotein (pyridoxamine 5'-phosphate oxidase superfamily)